MRRTNDRRPAAAAAFTLVELLVVIGIIALLIGILLPSLNKARQQANSVDCQSRLHQMGLSLNIYIGNSKGLLPWGVIDRSFTENSSGTVVKTYPSPYTTEFWWWYDELALTMNHNFIDASSNATALPAVFTDRDAIAPNDGSIPEVYAANERVFWKNTDVDTSPDNPQAAASGSVDGNMVPQYRASRLGRGSAFLIWDAPQCADLNSNAYGLATELDGNELEFGHYFDSLSAPGVTYTRPISPCGVVQSQNGSVCKSAQKKYNYDQPAAFANWVGLRFRHLTNTSMNALCGDGHVETRRVGGAMVTDFVVRSPYGGGGGN